MLPSPSGSDRMNRGARNVIQECQCGSLATIDVDLSHDGFRKTCHVGLFTTWEHGSVSGRPAFGARWQPTLDYCVMNIVAGCSEKVVSGVAARRIVAAVKHPQAIWNWPMRKPPCDPVGTFKNGPATCWSWFFADEKLAIAKGSGARLPWPALIRAASIDLGPEALGEGCTDRRVRSSASSQPVVMSVTKAPRPSGTFTVGNAASARIPASHVTSYRSVVRDRLGFAPLPVPSSLARGA